MRVTTSVLLVLSLLLTLVGASPVQARTREPARKVIKGCVYTAESPWSNSVDGPGESPDLLIENLAEAVCAKRHFFSFVKVKLVRPRRRGPDKVVAVGFKRGDVPYAEGTSIWRDYWYWGASRLCTDYWLEHPVKLYTRAIFKRPGHRRVVLRTANTKGLCAR